MKNLDCAIYTPLLGQKQSLPIFINKDAINLKFWQKASIRKILGLMILFNNPRSEKQFNSPDHIDGECSLRFDRYTLSLALLPLEYPCKFLC